MWNPGKIRVGPAETVKTGGIKKTDADITNQALTTLRANLPKIARGIGIQTKEGVVTVFGKVGSTADVERIIQLIKGGPSSPPLILVAVLQPRLCGA